MRRVVVVGGGITGLALAHALEKAAERYDVKLLEASERLGGNICTVTHNGFAIDTGPDSWVATKPHATRLARELGLGDELIGTRPDSRKVYIVWQKRLHPLPEGLVLGIPTEWRPFATTELLDLGAKLRAGLDLIVPQKRWAAGEDESIASFVSRRLGSDIADRIVGPLLGGIFAGDAAELSVRACVPQLVEAEAKYGSLIRAMRALKEQRREQAAKAGAVEPTTFISLKRGLGDLVINIAHKLRDAEVSTSAPVRRVAPLPAGDARGRWAVETGRDTLYADHVALTVPAHAAARMLDADEEAESILASVRYVSTATVFLAFKKYDVRNPLDGSGFLVPRGENRPILACTYVSSKWDHRAPAGQILLRLFFGGANNEAILAKSDEALVRVAREQVLDLLGIERPPMFAKVFRFDHASPQPDVGHLERMERLFARVATTPGLYVGGNGYVGSGIPDAIKQGEEIAAKITAEAGTRP